jgi:uncharacterized protein (DUF1800 family)
MPHPLTLHPDTLHQPRPHQPRPHQPSRAQRSPLRLALTAAIPWCTALMLGTTPVAYAEPLNAAQAAWRVSSRLGYGPSPANASVPPDAKLWARQQLDAALAASRNAPSIPAEVASFSAPINDIAREFHAENEARRAAREQNKATAAMLAASSPASAAKPMGMQREYSNELHKDAIAWRVMACSNASIEQPLLARMTEFWFNHLNVFSGKGNVRPFAGNYVVNVIRPHALGKFEDLLLASARHPAMLFYLDQAESKAKGINENYARELMELHSLGVNGGYSQNDVRELARILTGRTVVASKGEGFAFNERQHDVGDKIFLGRGYKTSDFTGGLAEGDEAIRMLARHPATAQRIAQRLAATFVSDAPAPALVARLASTFTRSQGDIYAVMSNLVESPEFWQADNRLFKTPMDFACSALAAQGGAKTPRDIQQTLGFLNQAGQGMHNWQTPDGYKTDAATWLAPEALTRRADYALNLGKNNPEPTFLQPFFSANTLERIAREAPAQRAGLMLASPDFMSK